MFSTRSELNGKVTVIDIPRRLDIHNSDELRKLLHEFVARGNYHWVFNLENTEYIDSSGLGAFVSQISECRSKQGDIYLAAPSEFVRSLLEITHLNKILKSFDSVRDAVHGFR